MKFFRAPFRRTPGGLRVPLVAAALALVALVSCQPRAHAQDARACIDDLSDEAVAYRLKKIERIFDDGRAKARGWRIGWIGGFVAVGSAQLALAYHSHQRNRPWDRFGFAYAAAGAGALAIGLSAIPMPGIWGSKRLRRRPADTAEQRREKLHYATDLLERGAFIETLVGSERPVVTATVFGVVGGTIKAAKWPGRTRGNTAAGFILPPAVALVSVLTAPKHLRKGWEQYRAMACTEQYYDRGDDLELDLSVTPGGVSFAVTF